MAEVINVKKIGRKFCEVKVVGARSEKGLKGSKCVRVEPELYVFGKERPKDKVRGDVKS